MMKIHESRWIAKWTPEIDELWSVREQNGFQNGRHYLVNEIDDDGGYVYRRIE